MPQIDSTILQQVFKVSPRAAILAEDDKVAFERDKDAIPFQQEFKARIPYFSGWGGLFHLMADSATVNMKVWFKIRGVGDKRKVDLQKAELNFSKPWGSDYFFYCRDETPAKFHLKPMPSADELRASGAWCQRQENETCGDHVCCEKNPQEDYFEYARPHDEKWTCNGVKYIRINRLVFTSDDARPDIEARVDLRVNPYNRLVPRMNFKISNKDINLQYYGALMFSNNMPHFERARRQWGNDDVTAAVESFFYSFGLAGVVTTAGVKP